MFISKQLLKSVIVRHISAASEERVSKQSPYCANKLAGRKCASNLTLNFKSKLAQNVFTVLRQYIKGLLISILN
jgi:hypothetical protein